MKPAYLVPPVLALVVSSVWIGYQHTQLSELEKKVSVMKERIAAYEALPEDDDPSAKRSVASAQKKDPFLLPDGSLDWAAIGQMIVEAQRGGGMPRDFRAFMRIQGKLLEMSVDELQETLEKVDALDVSQQVRQILETTLMGMLVQKAPEQALDMMKDHLSNPDGMMRWQLQQAFSQWANKDPAAALAWFDQQKKAGTFETKALDPNKSIAMDFEAKALQAMLKTDKEGVSARLAKLSEEERKSTLKRTNLWIGGEGLSDGYLELVRDHLDDDSRLEVVGDAFSALVHNGGLEGVSKKLNETVLGADERTAALERSVKAFARPWNREVADLKEVYEWAQKEDSDRAAELTGKAFAEYGNHGNTDFESTFREVVNLTKEQENREILDNFIQELRRPEHHVNEIQDEVLKEAYVELIDLLKPDSSQENAVPSSTESTLTE